MLGNGHPERRGMKSREGVLREGGCRVCSCTHTCEKLKSTSRGEPGLRKKDDAIC